MILFTSFQKLSPTVCSIFFFLVCSGLHAQDQSARDTIDYIINHHKDHIQVCEKLSQLGIYYRVTGSHDNAIFVANQLKTLSEKYKYKEGLYNAYSLLGNVNVNTGEYEKGLLIANEWLQLANKNNNEPAANRAHFLKVLLLFRKGELDSAVAVSKRILEAPHISYDSVTFPKFITMIGSACLNRGDFHSANKYYLEGLKLAEMTRNEELQSICLNNLSILNQELGNFSEALKYQRKALVLLYKNNLMLNIGLLYENMGITYSTMGVPDSAIFYYDKALVLLKQMESEENIAILHDNKGLALVALNQLDSGMYYLQLAKQDFIRIQSKDVSKIADNRLKIGKAWMQMAEVKKDKTYLKQGLAEMLASKELAEKEKIENIKMDAYWSLSRIYESLGNESKAFLYLKKYNTISDSIRSGALTSQIAEMQTKYETEKKENEIIKLNAGKLLDVEKIARQKTLNYSLLAIAALLLFSGFSVFRNIQHKRTAEKQVAILEKQNAIESMRTKIASDVHDEMGANLTRLGLNAQQLLQIPAIPEQGKQLIEKMALQSKDIITGMREIIWASNPANDNLKSMLGFMRQYIDRFFDGTQIRPVVNFPHDIGDVTLHPEVRRSLFLILKESLNNAVKYSGSDRIDIEFRTENEKFQFTVKDYGKGLEDKSKDEFSSGMHNMQMRAQQIQSLFKLITAPGQGVQISIEGNLY
jgi:signal transduction histidine kinase